MTQPSLTEIFRGKIEEHAQHFPGKKEAALSAYDLAISQGKDAHDAADAAMEVFSANQY